MIVLNKFEKNERPRWESCFNFREELRVNKFQITQVEVRQKCIAVSFQKASREAQTLWRQSRICLKTNRIGGFWELIIFIRINIYNVHKQAPNCLRQKVSLFVKIQSTKVTCITLSEGIEYAINIPALFFTFRYTHIMHFRYSTYFYEDYRNRWLDYEKGRLESEEKNSLIQNEKKKACSVRHSSSNVFDIANALHLMQLHFQQNFISIFYHKLFSTFNTQKWFTFCKNAVSPNS